MILDVLPERHDSAAGNMAADFLLLQRYPAETHARFRAYGWQRPAFTFGFSQRIAWVREQVAPFAPVELCRRPTGGGLVDHRQDWTYALVIPRGHALYDARAIESYRLVHLALADALGSAGCPAKVKTSCESAEGAGCADRGVCFQRAELHDVVRVSDAAKIAGAAQKRNKRGLLFQGSLWRPAAGAIDIAIVVERFIDGLARTLDAAPSECPWPEYAEEEASALTEHYASTEWLEQR